MIIKPEYIDHTLLRPDAKEAEVVAICDEAKEFGFYSVCLEPKWLPVALRILSGSSVLPITVIGFPSGAIPSDQKREQALAAVVAGAREVDMVLNRDLLKAKRYREVFADIHGVVEAAGNAPVKVILETSELSRDEKVIASALSVAAGARFVKTSTGFSKSGATVEDVALMREVVGPNIGVKASGGIRTSEEALKMLNAGASRLGLSASVAILKGAKAAGGGY